MDIFTHALLPYLLGSSLRMNKKLLAAFVLGGIAPDLDLLVVWINSIYPTSLLIVHRGFTHTFFFGFFTALIVLYLASRRPVKAFVVVDNKPDFCQHPLGSGIAPYGDIRIWSPRGPNLVRAGGRQEHGPGIREGGPGGPREGREDGGADEGPGQPRAAAARRRVSTTRTARKNCMQTRATRWPRAATTRRSRSSSASRADSGSCARASCSASCPLAAKAASMSKGDVLSLADLLTDRFLRARRVARTQEGSPPG